MAKKTPPNREPEPSALRSVSDNGEAPESRLRSASQAYEVAVELDRADKKRRQKRERMYKAYNRFPPKEYSRLEHSWESNVNFGMLAYIIDNQASSFYDMLTERTQSAQFLTKKGNLKDKAEWSEYIGLGFDQALESWDEFLLNQEQDLQDMLLFGKGLEMWMDNDGFQTEHVSADEILVPDSTKIDLSNFDTIAVKWTFQLNDLYKSIQDKEAAEQMGWNVEAVIEAMRWRRESWTKKTNEEFMHGIKEGNITITSHLKENVPVYIVFIREFSGKVSKHMVLRDYAPAFSLTRSPSSRMDDDQKNTKIDEIGFLFSKTEMFESYKNVFAVFIDNAGSGMWHNTPSLGEKIFVACRQYDRAMNAIMDAIMFNMKLILQGDTAEAHEKIKDLVFGPMVILPPGVIMSQHRIALPTAEATQALQFIMLDMNRGIGNYRIHEKGAGGEAPTATQTQLDATEAAKLTGTQLRRFNSQHSIYYREIYRRLTTMKRGEKGYEIFKAFKEFMEENGVPEDAWKFENIRSIKSNMLSGAGSPSYKLMAANQTIAFTNITPKDDGQLNAIRDGIAALQGRQNVDRYLPKVIQPDPTWKDRVIGHENELSESPILNPQNLMVYASDNHVDHIASHLNDMARTLTLVNQSIQAGKPNKDDMKTAATKMLNLGGHVNAHMQYLQRDQGKIEQIKQFQKDLQQVQREADQLAQQLGELQKKQADEMTQSLDQDPEIRKQIALSQIQIDTKQKLANISIGATATKHQTRVEIDKDKAANQIAIQRAKEIDKLETARKTRRKTP